MAMKRAKSARGHRWKKGQSCVSNPENTSHREAAKGRFFQKLDGDSSLTVDALAKHAAILTVGSDEKTLNASLEDDQSVGKSFNTFATHFTTCTVPAFEKFFQNFSIASDIHKRMLAVHATAQEYLRNNGLPETSTSYLCAFMVSLEGVKESEDDVAATLSLISRVIRKVSLEVLRAKYGEMEKLFHDIFTVYADADNKDILINVIGCLSILLRAQNEHLWELSFTRNLLTKMLVYTTCEHAKVRKCAQYSVTAILKGSSFMNADQSDISDDEEMEDNLDTNEQLNYAIKKHFNIKPVILHPAAKDVGEFILYNLKLATNSKNEKLTMHLLIFLQQIICHLPKDTLKKCCSTVLGIMHIGNSVVNGRSLKIFQTLFSAEFVTALETDVNEALINALIHSGDIKKSNLNKTLKLVPYMNDVHVCSIWMPTVSLGIRHLTRLDEKRGIGFVGSYINMLTSYWKSDHATIHEQIFFEIERLLDECFEPLGEKLSSIYTIEALQAFQAVELALSFQFQSAWPYIFKSLAAFYRVMGKFHSQDMMLCLKNLSELSANADISYRDLIENVVGAAIINISPEVVLEAVPLKITGSVSADEKNFWILPLLTRYVKRCRLCFFVSYFIPLANKCALIMKTYKNKVVSKSEEWSTQVLINTYETIERQIWFLFKSFADEATDVKEALGKDSGIFGKLIFDTIRLREDVRVDVLKGLRNLINASKDDPQLMIKYSKNFLPALFNLYLKNPADKEVKASIESTVVSGHRLAIYETIQKYMEIIPYPEALRFFNLIMDRYEKESSSSSFTHKALLSLARLFIPYLDELVLSKFFTKVTSCLLCKESKVQKTVYRVIEDILSLKNENFFKAHKSELINLLVTSQPLVSRNAWAPRLKCYLLLLSHFQSSSVLETYKDKLIEQTIREVIHCCGPQYSLVCRKNAFSLLLEIGNTIQRLYNLSYEDTFSYCFDLLPNFDLSSSSTTSNTILALRFLAYNFQDLLPSDKMISKMVEVSAFLSNATRDVVKASLAFIRLMFVVNPPVVMSNLIEDIIKSILEMSPVSRKKFRTQLRDLLACFVRKYGADRMRAIVPEKDGLWKLLINIVRTENRKKKLRKLAQKDKNEVEEEKEIVPSSLDEILAEIDREIEEEDSIPEKKKQITKIPKSKKQTWILEEEDDIVDLLDLASSQNIKKKEPKTKHLRFKDEEEPKTDEEKYGFRIDRKTNKFIISDKWEPEDIKMKEDGDDDFLALDDLKEILSGETKSQPKAEQAGKRKRTASQNSDEVEQAVSKEIKTSIKRNKFDYGSEFRSKKAGGDKMKKLGIAPYAYVQFSKEKLNRRKKSKYAGQYKELVKGRKGKSNSNSKKKRN